MVFPVPHHYLTFGGPFGTNEEWSVGLRFAMSGAAPTQAEEQTQAIALMDVLKAQWVLPLCPIGNAAKLAWLKWNRIGVDGRYANGWTTVVDIAPLNSPSMGSHPFQIALVATLRTGKTRGLAKAGRIYLPSPKHPSNQVDSQISVVNAKDTANWVAGLIHALNQVNGVGTCYVMSAVREGAAEVVRAVEVGTVLDTMRSRRTNLLEARQSTDVQGVAAGTDF